MGYLFYFDLWVLAVKVITSNTRRASLPISLAVDNRCNFCVLQVAELEREMINNLDKDPRYRALVAAQIEEMKAFSAVWRDVMGRSNAKDSTKKAVKTAHSKKRKRKK